MFFFFKAWNQLESWLFPYFEKMKCVLLIPISHLFTTNYFYYHHARRTTHDYHYYYPCYYHYCHYHPIFLATTFRTTHYPPPMYVLIENDGLR